MFTDVAGEERQMITIRFDGRELSVPAGISVAAALLGCDITTMRTTPQSGAARAAYCMMGICFDCLMVIDGEANQQACMVEVRDGMTVAPQQGAPEIMVTEVPS